MSEHLERASKALGISVERLQTRDPKKGLTVAEEALYEEWRMRDHYQPKLRVPLTAIAEGTGIDMARLRQPKLMTPNERARECAFVIFYLTQPVAEALELAKEYQLPPSLIQQVLRLREQRSEIEEGPSIKELDIPEDYGSIGALRKGKLRGLWLRLRQSEELIFSAFDFTGSRGYPAGTDCTAPDPLLGVLLRRADHNERLIPVLDALGELIALVEHVDATAGQVARRPRQPRWIARAKTLLEQNGVPRETSQKLLRSLWDQQPPTRRHRTKKNQKQKESKDGPSRHR